MDLLEYIYYWICLMNSFIAGYMRIDLNQFDRRIMFLLSTLFPRGKIIYILGHGWNKLLPTWNKFLKVSKGLCAISSVVQTIINITIQYEILTKLVVHKDFHRCNARIIIVYMIMYIFKSFTFCQTKFQKIWKKCGHSVIEVWNGWIQRVAYRMFFCVWETVSYLYLAIFGLHTLW